MHALTQVSPHAGLVDEGESEFRVSTAAYRGPELFAQEMQRIFYTHDRKAMRELAESETETVEA